jgi:class 3 adenylate cyclase
MATASAKNLRSPDESVRMPGITQDLVEVGGMTVSRTALEPGWRWSSHVRPLVGGDWCEAHHLGVVLSGRFGVRFRDGSAVQFGQDDVYDIPPGHDGYAIGDEPVDIIEWSGTRTFARGLGLRDRALATLLFTDIVDSTRTAVRLGDVAWREALSRHFQAARARLEQFHGREIVTTGDGLLAVFDGPAVALRCAAAIRAAATREGLPIRAGVHVGEVELVGADVRGVAVHEAARIMSAAGPNEILVSDTTRMLTAAGFAFEDRGTRQFKGLPQPSRIFAYLDDQPGGGGEASEAADSTGPQPTSTAERR